MEYESQGPSLSELRERDRGRKLHHLRVYADATGTPEKPAWIVEHHTSEQDKAPRSYTFSDGGNLIHHLQEHASIPSQPGREVKPRPEDIETRFGRAQGDE